MVIKFIDDYKKAKANIDPRIRKNGAYPLNFEYVVEDRLREGAILDIEVSKDGKTVRLTDKDAVSRLPGYNSVSITDINLLGDDGIEILKSKGDLIDAKQYYGKPLSGINPSIDALSVFNVSYNRSVFDKDGIEMQVSNYFKGAIPCADIKQEDNDAIIGLLLSAGNIMPIFYGDKFEIPTNSASAIVDILSRDEDNPAIAYRTRVERGKSADLSDYAITNYSMGFINSPWPELLRISSGETFADNIDGIWEVRKDSLRSASGDIDEIINVCTDLFSEGLEESNTKKLNLSEYNALRQKVDKVLESREKGKSI